MAVIIDSTTITPNPVTTGQSIIISVKAEVTQTTYAELQSYTYSQIDSSGKTYLQLETATP